MDKDINDMSDVMLRLLFAAVAACSVFAATDLFTDPQIVPKWLFSAVAAAALGVCASLRVLAGRPVAGVAERMLPPLFAAVGVAEAAYALLLWCGLWPPGRSARLEGSFDNAAGLAACLCASLPFALLVAVRVRGWRRRAWMAGAGLMAVVVALSGSRSGWMAAAVIAVAWGWRKWGRCFRRLSRRLRLGLAVVAILLLVAAAVGTYRFKQASADGRTLIWRCAAEMVAARPAEAVAVAARLDSLWADYDLCMLLGKLHAELGHSDSAQACYRRAHFVCPSRYAPLYEAYRLYRQCGDSASARRVARAILKKKPKVASRSVRRIVAGVRSGMSGRPQYSAED